MNQPAGASDRTSPPALSGAEPLVSVMMPVYNTQAYLGEAIESILAQTYPRWELIVVDDGSTDESLEVAQSFHDSRIRVFHQPNLGEAAARNEALRHMNGELVAFLDADDRFLPEHFALTIGYLTAHPEMDGVYTDGLHINQDGKSLQRRLSERRRGPFEGSLFEQLVRASDVFGPPICVVLRRAPILRLGLQFDPQIVIGPDWDFTTRYSETTCFGYVDRVTCHYRIHQTNISLKAGQEKRLNSLARCREKAIKLAGFEALTVETRAAVFYTLLVELLDGQPQRQTEITAWLEFHQLPSREQARIFRLIASRAIMTGSVAPIEIWLRESRRLDSGNRTAGLLLNLFRFSPRMLRFFLRLKNRAQIEEWQTSPFQDLAEIQELNSFHGSNATTLSKTGR